MTNFGIDARKVGNAMIKDFETAGEEIDFNTCASATDENKDGLSRLAQLARIRSK